MSLPIDLRSISRRDIFYNPTMDNNIHKSGSSTPSKANHLCVLVHGLWGHSGHLRYISESLRKAYGEDELIILAVKKNASSFTYDGIEIGGERVAKEIEETLEELQRDGYKITRFSIVGYSLGGLIARYAVGLLDQKGYFDHITPINFTTFASPHLGVRTPLVGFPNHLWNVLGARTLSASGRQLFAVDNFRDTGRSLLSVLADSDSIFIHALSRFQRRTLYANVVNDRTAVFYTTGISRNDPYTQIDKLKLNYVKGYEPVILDPDLPCEVKQDEILPTFYQRFTGSSRTALRRAPIYLALTVLIPIGVVAFLINSGIQTFRSRRRILLHEVEGESNPYGIYRIPYMMREARAGLEDVFEIANSAQDQEYLPEGSEEALSGSRSRRASERKDKARLSLETEKSSVIESSSSVSSDRMPDFPTLALTKDQFSMIESLDDVGFRKYPVYIHKSSHSHAAIIVRTPREAFEEGKVVMRHWLEREFDI